MFCIYGMAWRTPGSSVSPKSSRSAPREVQQLESIWLFSTETSSKCMCIRSYTNSLFVVMSLPLHNPLFSRTSTALVASWIGESCVCVSPYSPLIFIHFLLIQRSKAETEGTAPLRRCFMLAECLCFDLPELIRIVVSRRTFLEKGTGTSHCTLECSACVGFQHCTALRTSRCQALYLPETQKLRRIWQISHNYSNLFASQRWD